MKTEPFRVRARIGSPLITAGPIMLDALLYAATGMELGAQAPGGWADLAEVDATPLPLARVERDGMWWHACSQASPPPQEAEIHIHRKPALEHLARLTTARSVNRAAGPDKMLRIKHHVRIALDWLEWTGVGDAPRVASLLSRLPGVGARVSAGFGTVLRWQVSRDGDAPPLTDYGRLTELRHLPCSIDPEPPESGQYRIRTMPLRAPYYRAAGGVRCMQAS